MADLLECLIQIKGVADTPRRLDARLGLVGEGRDQAARGRGARIARAMAEAEERFAGCLALMLSEDRPPLPPLPRVAISEGDTEEVAAGARWCAQFSARRAGTVAVLERCSADQLNRIGLEPARGAMTVADLVALMLAHDTDCLGEIR